MEKILYDDVGELSLTELKKYAEIEKIGRLAIDQAAKIRFEAYNQYSRLSDKILFKKGNIKDPLAQLSDPLSEVTRKERKTLLGVSLLALIITQVELFPTKISAFGIDFSTHNIAAFFKIFSAVIIYFLVIFIIYCFSDIRSWIINTIARGKNLIEFQSITFDKIATIQDVVDAIDKITNIEYQVDLYSKRSRNYNYFSGIRVIVEFIVPIVFALFALYYSFTFDAKKLDVLTTKANDAKSGFINEAVNHIVLKDSISSTPALPLR